MHPDTLHDAILAGLELTDAELDSLNPLQLRAAAEAKRERGWYELELCKEDPA
jgi:hypothetical protein